MDNPIVKIPRLLPVVDKINQLRRNVEGELRGFDIIRWTGTPYGTDPFQCLDIHEVNDLCPRDGWPTILCIHGGGWVEGDKSQFNALLPQFARRKVMAVGVNYRLAPQVTWKEQVDDVLAALDFIRAQQVDLNRIALWGTSAGAHLALLAAAQRPEQIRCVLTIGAATHPPNLSRDLTQEAFPRLDEPDASPLLACTKLPSTMLIHGEQDPIIPIEQHHTFVAKHPNVESIVVKDGDHHVRWPPLSGLQTRRRAVNWVIQQLDIPQVGSKWRRRRKQK